MEKDIQKRREVLSANFVRVCGMAMDLKRVTLRGIRTKRAYIFRPKQSSRKECGCLMKRTDVERIIHYGKAVFLLKNIKRNSLQKLLVDQDQNTARSVGKREGFFMTMTIKLGNFVAGCAHIVISLSGRRGITQNSYYFLQIT